MFFKQKEEPVQEDKTLSINTEVKLYQTDIIIDFIDGSFKSYYIQDKVVAGKRNESYYHPFVLYKALDEFLEGLPYRRKDSFLTFDCMPNKPMAAISAIKEVSVGDTVVYDTGFIVDQVSHGTVWEREEVA